MKGDIMKNLSEALSTSGDREIGFAHRRGQLV